MRNNSINTVLIKVGTDVIANKDGYLNGKIIASIAEQIAAIRATGLRVALVTSGAVAAGRSRYHRKKRRNETLEEKQHYAAVGQVRLMAEYEKHFDRHEIITGQFLLTGQDMDCRIRRKNIGGTLERIFCDKTPSIPILNENDPVATKELKFTDNDQLAGDVALLIKAQRVVLLTSVKGLLRDVKKPWSLIKEVPLGSRDWEKYITNGTSGNGRGGMMNKGRIAARLAQNGIETVIARGKTEHVLERILLAREQIGTCFKAS